MAQPLRKFWSERLSSLAAFLEEEKCHVHPSRSQTEPHPQTSLQGAAGKSLRRLDRSGKNNALDGPGEVKAAIGRMRRPRRRPLSLADAHASGEEHDVGGVYREIVPNEKLVFTWAWKSTPERESLVTVLIKPDGDGSLLTLTHEQFFDEDARDRHQQGWAGALDKMEKSAW